MSAETVRLAEELETQHGLSPAKVFQRVASLASLEYLLSEAKNGRDEAYFQEQVNEAKAELLRVISSYGGVKVVDKWLTEHDTHQLPGNVRGIDWSFLPENLRP